MIANNEQGYLWNRSYIAILITAMLTQLNNMMIGTIIAKYAGTMGATVTLMGLAFGIVPLTALPLRPFVGKCADKYNKRNLVFAAIFLYIIGNIGCVFSTSTYLLLLFRVICGVGVCLSTTVLAAMACEYIPENRMGTGMGYFAAAMVAPMAIGPALSLAMAASFGYHSVFYINIGFCIISAISLCITRNMYHAKQKTVICKREKVSPGTLISKESVVPSMVNLFFAMAFSAVSAFLPLYGEQVRIKNVGFVFTVYVVVMLLIRPVMGWISDNKGLLIMIIPLGISYILGLFITGTGHSIYIISFAIALMAIGNGGLMPALQSLGIKRSPVNKRGLANSTFYIGFDIGSGFGPTIGGSIAAMLGYGGMIKAMIIPVIIGIIIAFAFKDSMKLAA